MFLLLACLLHSSNWDHELIGVIWGCAGGTGLLFAYQGICTSVQVFFPAVWVAYAMMTHSSGQAGMMNDTDESHAWMELHMLHGLAFGGAALCRLLQRVPESIFLFFMGAWIFVFSSPWLTDYVVKAVSSEKHPNDPIDHTALLVVVTTGAMFFPLHFATLTHLRTKLDEMTYSTNSGGFEAIPTSGDDDETADRGDSTLMPQSYTQDEQEEAKAYVESNTLV